MKKLYDFMMKYCVYPLIMLAVFAGCSSLKETANMNADERFTYALELYNDEDYEETIQELQAILLQYPGNPVIDDAQFYLAETRYKREEYILAAYEYSKLIKNMPASEFLVESQYKLAQSYYQLSPDFTLDQRYSKKAIEEFQAFIEFFPLDERVTEAEAKIDELNEKLALKDYNAAKIYEKMSYYSAALIFYTSVEETFHDTKYASMAMYSKILLLLDRERETEAYAEINKFLQRFPDNPNYNDVEQLKSSLDAKLSLSR